MKKIEVDEDFYKSAVKLAEYINDCDSEFEDFKRFLIEGNDPKDHIYYHAGIVGGWDDSIYEIIAEETDKLTN